MDPFTEQPAKSLEEMVKQENWEREMSRRAQDTLRVANPEVFTIRGKEFRFPFTERMQFNDPYIAGYDSNPTFNQAGDYFVTWEQGRHRIPAGGTADMIRYIAEKYTRDMTTKVINYYIKVEGEALLKKIGKEQPNVLLDKYLENIAVWDKMPKTDDPQLLAEIMPQLLLGIVKEHGTDDFDIVPQVQDIDLRSNADKTLSSIGNRRLAVDSPVEKELLEKELTVDDTEGAV